MPLTGTPVVDTTGAGDAFVAALITASRKTRARSGLPGRRSPWLARLAAILSVGHPAGRPALTPRAIQGQLDRRP